jgi:hypothetical protein
MTSLALQYPDIAAMLAQYHAMREREENKAALRVLELCESPIERQFLMALALTNCISWPEDWMRAGAQWLWSLEGSRFYADLMPQVEIVNGRRKFRLDFVLDVWCVKLADKPEICNGVGVENPLRIAIELDGEAFHDANEKQVNRDRGRDRIITALGYHILRFSGKEVHNTPGAIVDEIIACVYSLAETRQRTSAGRGDNNDPVERFVQH